jgi:uncharacterized protein YijF (DUF1287 family)
VDWKQLLAYMTGSVAQELSVCNDCLVIANRIMRQQTTGRVRLSDGERKALAEIGKKLGRLSHRTRLSWRRQRGLIFQGA